MKTKLKNQKGFTIIEVLIVLAIAGLILLIVFLAVPALQRNSRNTQRKSDAGAALSGVSEYINNNDGVLPQGLDMTQVHPQWKRTQAAPANGPGSGTEFKTSFYKANNSTDIIASMANTSGSALATIDTAKLYVQNYIKCNVGSLGPVDGGAAISTTVGGTALVTNTGATSRNIISVYAVEGSGGKVTLQCTES